MAIRSQWRAWLFLAAVLGVILFCASHHKARAETAAPPVRMALAPFDVPVQQPPQLAAPFGLAPTALPERSTQAMNAKWKSLQANIALETRIAAMCRQMPEACPASTARFLAIVDAARETQGRARAGLINRAVNLAIRFSRDTAQFGVPDVWQSPLMTFASGSGDCEDYAIAKYVALREAGMSADDLKLVIVHNERNGEDHAVTAARIDGEWLVLDNRTMLMLTDAQASDLKPLIALGEDAPKPVLVQDAGLDGRFAPMPAFG
ncbi:MAG TPA: transglutaminase-like cysteine peptidase [Pseudolabrys sp.]|nr:transglutaminase-like cysteine peptidase [Pseudolabrys sp.]